MSNPYQPNNPQNPYGSQPEQYGQPPDPYTQPQYGQPNQYGQPQYSQQYQVPQNVGLGGYISFASWGARLGGYLLDGLILFGVFFVGLMIITGVALAINDQDTFIVLAMLFYLLMFIANIAYFIYFWSKRNGQTLGQRAVGIRVVRLDGQPINAGTAALRYLGFLANSAAFGIGWLWPLWDAQRQGFHDKIAGTIVING